MALLLLLCGANFRTPPLTPTRLPPAATRSTSPSMSAPPDVPFASSYPPSQLAALWKALAACYRSEALAREAVRRQPQVMCPVYASPSLLTQSADALVELVGEEEAVEIMLRNPMVLTCGSRELAASTAAEVRQAANVRFYLDKYVNPAGLLSLLALLSLLKVVSLVLDKHG
ncbi:hypothetical protein AB1Y20_009616 [Prymnesium parvum]|uniref:Uncharacterized protein n=1 Tax=Prymnesium parvum TaxID=97485 RepID=A0AB34K2N3_PRYPA